MKTFLDLLGTKLQLNIDINGDQHCADLNQTLTFNAEDTVIIDGIEILPRFRHLANDGKLNIDQPFYQWLHCITGQGWLLLPQI